MKKKLLFIISLVLLLICVILGRIFLTPKPDSLYIYKTVENLQPGQDNIETIKSILDSIQTSPKLANDTELIWKMISTILKDTDSRQTAINLLNNYLSKTKHLKLETILTIKGNIGMLYMANEAYGDSIYIFNEIIAKAEKIINPDIRAKYKIQSYEYLGNMYAELGDYNASIAQYDRAINEFVENPTYNAACKYGSYINKADCYIQLKDYEKALQTSIDVEKIIPHLKPEIAIGVELFKNKNLVLIKSHQHKFDEAKTYLDKCNKLLEQNNDSAFLNSAMHVHFADCEMLIQQNKTDLAIQELTEILTNDSGKGFGIDTHVYELLSDIYKQTNQTEKFLQVSAKIYESEKEFNNTLKKDYLKYVEESFALNQLREKEKLYQNGIILLLIIILVFIIIALIAIIFLKKSRRNNLTDSLTNIYNRKYLTIFVRKKLKAPMNMAVIMADIDYFKNYNDTYGHPAGDKAIKAVAEILRESIRENDRLIRYGGEEFLILLENIDLDDVSKVCTRIAQKSEEKHILHENSKAANYLTLSLGVTLKTVVDDSQLKEAINEADQALYHAKQNGRNRYSVYDHSKT